MSPQVVPPLLAAAVKDALAARRVGAQDRAAAELALTYAAAIDAGGDLAKIGPALLSALEALQMSPRARAAGRKAGTGERPAANPLDQLAARRARKRPPKALDT